MELTSRHLKLIACALALATMSLTTGCSQTRTYRTTIDELDERLTVQARVKDDRLRCEIDAGEYRVASATLILRGGERIEPTTTARRPDQVVGGARVGLGTGMGRGPVGVGVGSSRRIGGRAIPGPISVMWDRPPHDDQPWFIEATLEVEPPITTIIPLGEITRQEPLESGRERQHWKLLHGPARAFIVEPQRSAMPRFVEDAAP